VDRAVVKEIGVGVVTIDFEHLGNIPTPWPPFDLNHDMDGVADIALDGTVRKFDAALQNTTRESRKSLFGRVRMKGGQCPGMTRIEKLQKIEGFTSTNLTHQNPVWPVTERRFEQVTDGNARTAVLRVFRFEAN
jgi:hypothetical protein